MAEPNTGRHEAKASRSSGDLPKVRIKYKSVPDSLLTHVKALSPRTHLGDLLRTLASSGLPHDLLQEIINEICGSIRITSELTLSVIRNGITEDLGLVSTRQITNVGVANIASLWNGAGYALPNFKYVGIGTGVAAENVTDVSLGQELTIEYNPPNLRALGVVSQPANNTVQVVGLVQVAGNVTPLITELGLFSQQLVGAPSSTNILWDRFVFGVITLSGSNGDSIQGTVRAIFNAGG